MPAPARTRPSPQRVAASPTRRPASPPRHLVVVDDVALRAQASRRRTARWTFRLGLASIVIVLFALAASHAILVSGQGRLDDLESKVSEAQAQYSLARLDVAQLEAPERIVRVAQERLGMAPPDRVTYLSPDGALAAKVGVGDATGEPTPTPARAGEPWASVKPLLGSQR